jgi:hypothetical protein
MEIAHLPPVKAVVLARSSRDAQSGIVLIARRGYNKYEEYGEINDITEADHLAVRARANAADLYPRWEFEGPAVIYDYNPTGDNPRALEAGTTVPVGLWRNALPNDTRLHGHHDPDTHELVDTFFVLVTAFDPAVRRNDGQQLVDFVRDCAHYCDQSATVVIYRLLVNAPDLPPHQLFCSTGSTVATPAPPADARTAPPSGIGRRAAQLIRPSRPIGFFAQRRLRLVQVSLDSLDPQLATLSQHGGIRECIKAFATQLQLGGSVQRLRGRNIRVTVEGTAANVQRFLDDLDAVWHRQLAMIGPLSTLEDVTITRRSHTDFQILKDLCRASLVETGRYSPDDYKTHTSRSATQEVYLNSDV